MDKIIASSLTGNALAQALSEVLAERWDNWDLSPFMAYLVDVCAPAALPYLADQFDVDGLRGFDMAVGEEQQRDLIKRSIELHKFTGTPWAIREACNTINFPVILLEEGITSHGSEPSSDDWAQFRILIEADTDRYITIEEARKLRLFVEFYKNERSHLIELGFYQSLKESLFRPVADDRETFGIEVITLELSPDPVELNPQGDEVCVEIKINMPWGISPLIYWGDETSDKIAITFSGEAGTSRITIISDRNATGKDRTIKAHIENAAGIKLGFLTILQWGKWYNAYNFAYSRAYNRRSPQLPYLKLNKQAVWLKDTGDVEQVELISNADWKNG